MEILTSGVITPAEVKMVFFGDNSQESARALCGGLLRERKTSMIRDGGESKPHDSTRLCSKETDRGWEFRRQFSHPIHVQWALSGRSTGIYTNGDRAKMIYRSARTAALHTLYCCR
ncbi:hypothetical protein ACJJTC_001552 [Scirpophaga incertulas]